VKHVILVCVMYAWNSFIPLKPCCTFTQKTRDSRVKGVVILPLGLGESGNMEFWVIVRLWPKLSDNVLAGFCWAGKECCLWGLGKVMLLPGFGEQVMGGTLVAFCWIDKSCVYGDSGEATLLPGFVEQVSGGLLLGFDEQARVVVVILRKSNVLTEFWWAGKGDTLAEFWWAGKSCCLWVLMETTLLPGFGEQVRVVLLLGFGEQVRIGLLLGFVEQTRVVFFRLRRSNAPTGFWWTSKGWGSCRVLMSRQGLLLMDLNGNNALAGFWWAGKGGTLTGFWWTGKGWTLVGFCWTDKSRVGEAQGN